ncbi:MAG: radical SAM protein [Elusimicrobia bacterium]|nr:radical SAM protein [Elusimicrobiota bacterium]
MRIDSFGAPLMVSWQFTRECDLACLHCCTDSRPGGRLPDELSAEEALRVAEQIASAEVPYVLFGGGEPAGAPHFLATAEALGRAGVYLKVETNGQRLQAESIARLSRLPVRSIQVSLDGSTQQSYGRLRPGASLPAAVETCRRVRGAGLPLEVTFVPTRFNILEAEAVMDCALELGAFRFNTGALMRLGRAARLWDALEPSSQDYGQFLRLLGRKERELAGRMEVCYRPFELRQGVEEWLREPPGTLSVQADGKVRVSAVLPWLCGDLRRDSLAEAWDAYRTACASTDVVDALKALIYGDLPRPEAGLGVGDRNGRAQHCDRRAG